MEFVDHAVLVPTNILGPQQWRPMIYAFPSIKSKRGARRRLRGVLLRNPIWSGGAPRGLKIQQQVLGGAYMIKIADSGRLSGYSRKLRGQSELCRQSCSFGTFISSSRMMSHEGLLHEGFAA